MGGRAIEPRSSSSICQRASPHSRTAGHIRQKFSFVTSPNSRSASSGVILSPACSRRNTPVPTPCSGCVSIDIATASPPGFSDPDGTRRKRFGACSRPPPGSPRPEAPPSSAAAGSPCPGRSPPPSRGRRPRPPDRGRPPRPQARLPGGNPLLVDPLELRWDLRLLPVPVQADDHALPRLDALLDRVGRLVDLLLDPSGLVGRGGTAHPVDLLGVL